MHAALLVASSSLHDMITWYSEKASGLVESHSKLHNISLHELVLVGGVNGGQRWTVLSENFQHLVGISHAQPIEVLLAQM